MCLVAGSYVVGMGQGACTAELHGWGAEVNSEMHIMHTMAVEVSASHHNRFAHAAESPGDVQNNGQSLGAPD